MAAQIFMIDIFYVRPLWSILSALLLHWNGVRITLRLRDEQL